MVLEGDPFLALEELGEVPRCKAGDARDLGEAKRLAQVLANERERATRRTVLASRRRALEGAFDVRHEAAVRRYQLGYGRSILCQSFYRCVEIVEASLIERSGGEQRLRKALEPGLEVRSRLLQSVPAVNEHRFDVTLEARREEVRTLAHALCETTTKLAEPLGRRLGAGLGVNHGDAT